MRNFWMIVCVCGNAVICTAWGIASLYMTGAPVDPLLMLLPAFWLVMSMSAGIHFVNYYLDAKKVAALNNDAANEPDLALSAFGLAWKPTCLAVLTTCVGLGSLCTSDILPVWYFGFQAVIGLLLSVAVLFLLLPSLLTLCRNRLPGAEYEIGKSRYWVGFSDKVVAKGGKPAIAFLVVLALAAIGFSRLEFSNKLNDQFVGNLKIKKDAAWFEEEIGPLLPFEVLVRFDSESDSRNVDRLNFVGGLQRKLDQLDVPCKTVSATSIIAQLLSLIHI